MLRTGWPKLLLILAVLFAYAPVACMVHPLKFDLIATAYPWRYFIGECLQHFHLPLWNPYQHLGYPIHADPQSGAWYPIAWIIGFFYGYDLYSISFEFILHLVIAGIGMQKLSSSLGLSTRAGFLASLAWVMSGFFVGNAQHLPMVISAAWMPWVLHFLIRMRGRATATDAVRCGLSLFMMITGGYPAILIVLAYLSVILYLWFSYSLLLHEKDTRSWLRFTACALLAALTAILSSAVMVKSFYDALPYITRGEGVDITQAMFRPFSPQSLISLMFPFATVNKPAFFGSDISMINAYFSIGMLAFFIYALTIRRPALVSIFLFFGLFALLASMGSYLPLRQWMYDYLPLMNHFRMPGIIRLFALSGLILPAAWAADSWFEEPGRHRQRMGLILLILLFIAVATAVVFGMQHKPLLGVIFDDPIHLYHGRAEIYEYLVFQAIIQALVITALWAVMRFTVDKAARYRSIALLIALDLITATRLNAPYTVHSPEYRMKNLQAVASEFPPGFPEPLMMPVAFNNDTSSRYQSLWFNMSCFRKQFGWDGYNPFALRQYDSLQFGDPPLFNRLICNPPVFTGRGYGTPGNKTDTAFFTAFGPNRMSIIAHTRNKSTLTLLQNNYPGWEVKVNGISKDIHTTARCFLGVDVPAGTSRVEFSYRPQIFVYAWISLVSLLVCVAAACRPLLRSAKNKEAIS